ncbi:MAG: phosphatase domain-containing protein [bacterium]
MTRMTQTLLLTTLLFGAFACGDSEPEQPANNTSNTDGKGDWFGLGDDIQYADLYNGTASVKLLPVRGRLVEEDPDDINDPDVTPFSQISQDETKRAFITVTMLIDGQRETITDLYTDNEGYFDTVVDISALNLRPGRYTMEIWHDGDNTGSSHVILLDEARTVPVVRSDVDLTYINTDFQSATAMFNLMLESADEREALPGMPSVYAGVRGDDAIPVTFLSGSPKFFKRTLEQKMILDGLEQDGVVLKPFKDIVASNVRDLSLTQIVPELKEQIGYKMTWLLKLRLQLPASTPEVLMGDDSEADFVVYNLYYRFLAGELTAGDLHDELVALNVTSNWMTEIDTYAPLVEVTPEGVPLAIYINHTPVTSETYDVQDWIVPDVTRYHDGAWPLAKDLEEEGLIGAATVEEVRKDLVASGLTQEVLDAQAAASDFLQH